MAFPPLFELIGPTVILLIESPIVFFSSRFLKLRPPAPVITYPRKELNLAVVLVIFLFVGVSVLDVIEKNVMAPLFQVSYPPFKPVDVLWWLVFYVVILTPMVFAMKRTNQGLATIGVSRSDGKKLLMLGLIMSVTLVTVAVLLAPVVGRGLSTFSIATIYGLVALTIGAFAEEAVWRGHLQTRLVAHSGILKGVFSASLLFALWHFPSRYLQYGWDGGLAASVTFLPAGLIFGITMLRAQNVIPGSMFHLSWNLVVLILFA